jgi:hypothetical protein
MKTITIDLDAGLWLNSKGQVQLFIGDEPKALETIPLIDLVRMEIDSHKVRMEDHLTHDDVKHINKLKKALQNCLAHVNNELYNAK